MAKAKGILACDVGNSRINLGCVVDDKVPHPRSVEAGRLDSLPEAVAELWGDCPAPKRIVASSVHPGNLKALESAAAALGQELLLVGRDLPLPIQTDLPEPARVGTDRLCSAAMAFHRLGQACVVADFGTAITVDCVSEDGVFLGGAILPGLSMSADALARGTAYLPKVKVDKPDWVFGKDTRQAIIGGIVVGARGALRELTEAYATELGHWPPLIATGGDAELVAGGYDIVHAIVPALSLMGIALAYHLVPEQR